MTIGAGIAIASMWLAVALVSRKDEVAAVFVALMAAFATIMVASPK